MKDRIYKKFVFTPNGGKFDVKTRAGALLGSFNTIRLGQMAIDSLLRAGKKYHGKNV